LEVESIEGFAGGQSRLRQMPLDAPTGSIGHFMFGQRSEEAGGRPAFLVGLFGQPGPD
jgi:hypothetical protein